MAMIPVGTKSGPVWRVAPSGTVRVYLNRLRDDGYAEVCSQGVRHLWATVPMVVSSLDLFIDRAEARAEFRARKAYSATAAAEHAYAAALEHMQEEKWKS